MVPSLTPGKSYYIKAWESGSNGVEIVESSWIIAIPDVWGIFSQWVRPTLASFQPKHPANVQGFFFTCFIDENAGLR